ncbi:MAG: hypothetical protein LBI82_03675 [Dysgonamonadaceae bacterium]|jgi:hypothetical protein|nr:hypothetical protein [Dysgonamonadaceae bacterium]
MIRKNKIQKKLFLFFATIVVGIANSFAQDIITLKDGKEIIALVYEIGDIDVMYKKIDNPNGPNYTLKISEIFMIEYANGSKDVFADTTKPAPVVENAQSKENLSLEHRKTLATTEETVKPYRFRMYLGIGSGHSYGPVGYSMEARFYQFGLHGGVGYYPNLDSPAWSIGAKAYFWKNLYFDSMIGVIGHIEAYEYNPYYGYKYDSYFEPVIGATEMLGVNWSWGSNVRFGVNLGIGIAFGFDYDLIGPAYDIGITISFGSKK